MTPNERFARQMLLFGAEGQERLRTHRVAVVGVGGLGTHVVQQLALLGVGAMALIDSQELDDTNRNRYVTARDSDPVPGTRKVDIAERLIRDIDPSIQIDKTCDSLVSVDAFAAVIGADCVFGCLDKEGPRLVLNELCAAYDRRYIDLASEILPGDGIQYGGRVCTCWKRPGCIVCFDLLDGAEAQRDLAGPAGEEERRRIYGIDANALGHSGPSVVSINGVVASLAVTEFMVAVTGVRAPRSLLTYYGNTGKVTTPSLESGLPKPNCYYCEAVKGMKADADVERYVREGVGKYLR